MISTVHANTSEPHSTQLLGIYWFLMGMERGLDTGEPSSGKAHSPTAEPRTQAIMTP